MRVRGVGGIVIDGDGRILVIERARPPAAGLWSIPGGKVEPGESDADAVVRELKEETGLDVAVDALAGRVVIGGYEIFDYTATVVGGTLAAGDDAADARWVTPAELRRLPTAPRLVETLSEWGLLR